jgi:hypothetical protein
MLGSLHRRPRGHALASVLNTVSRGRVPAGSSPNGAEPDPAAIWFEQHFHEAADHVTEFSPAAPWT